MQLGRDTASLEVVSGGGWPVYVGPAIGPGSTHQTGGGALPRWLGQASHLWLWWFSHC